MSEYKNDENHNEMETPITSVGGAKFFSKKPGKPNNHLKLVVNDVNDSVSIYNSINNNDTDTDNFNYEDFVMRF